jgi:hypothetical protein
LSLNIIANPIKNETVSIDMLSIVIANKLYCIKINKTIITGITIAKPSSVDISIIDIAFSILLINGVTSLLVFLLFL